MTGIYKRNTFTCKNVGLRISARDFSCFYVFIKDVRIQNICRGGGGGCSRDNFVCQRRGSEAYVRLL